MINFTKAHACGNDFLIILEDDGSGYDCAELARRLCARTTSIGADGIEFFACGDNLLKGAALNTALIAELVATEF